MRKNFFSLLLALAIVCSTMVALPMTASAAESGTCGDNLTWTLDDSGTLTISGTGEMYDYNSSSDTAPWHDFQDKITAVMINEGATSIGKYGFDGCKSITSITFPNSVSNIEENAFYDCTMLANITIPDSVASIGINVFDNTAYYNNPANWTEDVLYIGNHLIKSKTSLNGEYSVRAGTKTIAVSAFSDCTALTSVTIPDGVTNIKQRAFYNCTTLTDITIPDSVTSIEDDVFGKTAYYSEPANWKEYVLYIGNHLIESRGILDGEYSVRAGTKTIADEAFDSCRISSIILPDGITGIGNHAFSNCRHLNNVSFSNSVTSIGDYAFSGCTSLTDVTLPNGMKTVGEDAFYDCTALKNITIPDSVTRIGSGAFNKCRFLKNITIPDGITSIESYTFSDCRSLTDITLPDSVTRIGSGAFISCSMENFTIPDGIIEIEDSTFSGCTALNRITIPDSVTKIGDMAFHGCTSLTDITIPSDVTNIGEYAFQNCSSIKSADIPDGMTEIEKGTFYGCTALTSVTIPDSVKAIGEYAFQNCSSLTGIIIPDGMTSIADHTFNGCASFNTITIPDSVTSIGGNAFASCLSLRKIIIPSSVTSIGDYALLGNSVCRIYGNSGSYAQTYADKNNIPFVAGTAVGDKFYTDVVSDEWYVSAVQYAVDNGLFFGISDTEFAPDVAMNRAMLVTVLWRLEGKPTVSATNTFNDVPADEWYTDAIIWAAENDVVYGTGDGKFSPDDSITREQMAAILYRYAQKKGYDVTASTDLNTFPDGESTSSYARDALSWACGTGLIFGADGKLLPLNGATRAQVAAILMRYTEKVVQK